MREFYLCESCEAISGRINLYYTILVSHNNYTRRHVYIVSRMHDRLLHCIMPQTLQATAMALLRYFQATVSLPTAEEMALDNTVTRLANATVLHGVQAEGPGKHKPYTVFTAEQRATIGKYASEHGNTAAVKNFKANIEGGQLGESTFICLFKKRFFEELKKAKHSGATAPEVKSIVSRKRGRLLTLGDVETKAVRKAGTSVNVNIGAEGVVTAVDRTLLKKMEELLS